MRISYGFNLIFNRKSDNPRYLSIKIFSIALKANGVLSLPNNILSNVFLTRFFTKNDKLRIEGSGFSSVSVELRIEESGFSSVSYYLKKEY